MKKTLLVSIVLALARLCTACANGQADSAVDVHSTADSSASTVSGEGSTENTNDSNSDVAETTNANADVKYTLQYNFVDATLGDPSSLDIYFYAENDTELTLPDIDAYVLMTEPYTDICFY